MIPDMQILARIAALFLVFSLFILYLPFGLIFGLEKILIRKFLATEQAPEELTQIIAQTLQNQAGRSKIPRFLIYPDPVPNMLICKGWFSPGLILMSRGVLAHYQQAEVRQLLAHAIKISQKRAVFFLTYWSLVLEFTHRISPAGWSEWMVLKSQQPVPRASLNLGVWGGIRLLAVLPILTEITRMSGWLKRRFLPDFSRVEWGVASHQSRSLWPFRRLSGFSDLYVF